MHSCCHTQTTNLINDNCFRNLKPRCFQKSKQRANMRRQQIETHEPIDGCLEFILLGEKCAEEIQIRTIHGNAINRVILGDKIKLRGRL